MQPTAAIKIPIVLMLPTIEQRRNSSRVNSSGLSYIETRGTAGQTGLSVYYNNGQKISECIFSQFDIHTVIIW